MLEGVPGELYGCLCELIAFFIKLKTWEFFLLAPFSRRSVRCPLEFVFFRRCFCFDYPWRRFRFSQFFCLRRPASVWRGGVFFGAVFLACWYSCLLAVFLGFVCSFPMYQVVCWFQKVRLRKVVRSLHMLAVVYYCDLFLFFGFVGTFLGSWPESFRDRLASLELRPPGQGSRMRMRVFVSWCWKVLHESCSTVLSRDFQRRCVKVMSTGQPIRDIFSLWRQTPLIYLTLMSLLCDPDLMDGAGMLDVSRDPISDKSLKFSLWVLGEEVIWWCGESRTWYQPRVQFPYTKVQTVLCAKTELPKYCHHI